VALYVPQQAVKIVFNLVIANHVFHGIVVIDVVVFFGLFRRNFCYELATNMLWSLLVDKLYTYNLPEPGPYRTVIALQARGTFQIK